MMNQNGGSRTDTLVKLVLVFFLSLLSFSVGTFVGKQFSDSQHKIADLESGNSERVTASIPETKPEPSQAISEEEIAKLSDEFIKKEKSEENAVPSEPTTAKAEETHGEANGKAGAAEVTAPAKAKTDAAAIHDEINSVARRLAAGDKTLKEERAPSSAPAKKELPKDLANSALSKFTVQVASQGSEPDAQKMVDSLKAKGFAAIIIPAEVNGKKWYRVSIGQFDDRKAAMKERERVLKDGGVATAIIQKIAPL